jgi:cytochrome bd ubiquinol oxidase subunit II
MKDGHYIGGTFGWLIGAVSAIALLKGVQHRNDLAPFRFATLIFIAAFGTLACSFWPYMIPFSLTVEQAVSPSASLTFMVPAASCCRSR